MRKKMLPLLIMFLLCVLLARAGTTNADVLGTISVGPVPTISAPGIEFNVTVSINVSPKIDFYIIEPITWNPDIIELKNGGTLADIVEGPFMKNAGSTVFVPMGINNALGKIDQISCGFLDVVDVNGSGVLFTIQFRSKAVGETPIDIGYAVLLNSLVDPEWYLDPSNGLELNDGSVTVVPEFSASVLLPLLLIATIIAIIAAKALPRKRQIRLITTS